MATNILPTAQGQRTHSDWTELAVCRVPGQDDHGAAATLALVLGGEAQVDQDHGQHPYEQGDLEDQTGQSTKSERNSCVQQFILNTG